MKTRLTLLSGAMALALGLGLGACDSKDENGGAGAASGGGDSTRTADARLAAVDDSVNRMLAELSVQTDSLRSRAETREVQLTKVAELSPSTLAKLGNFVAEFKAMQATLRAKDDTISALRSRVVSLTAEVRRLRRQVAQLTGENAAKATLLAKADTSAAKADSILKRTEAVRDSALRKATTGYVLIATRDELAKRGITGKTNRLGLGRVVLNTVDPSLLDTVNIATTREFDVAAPSDKVVILSNHPAGSYVIAPNNGQSRIRPVDVDEFWSVSKVLVVMINR